MPGRGICRAYGPREHSRDAPRRATGSKFPLVVRQLKRKEGPRRRGPSPDVALFRHASRERGPLPGKESAVLAAVGQRADPG